MSITETEQSKRNQLKEQKPYVYEKIQGYSDKVAKGESIAIIQFQYDYRCNFKCEHCSVKGFQGRKQGRTFKLSDVKKLMDQADAMGLAQVVITGGEPLCFPDFYELVKTIDPQRFHIISDTNGWLLDKAKAKHLKEIGVDKIQLSLDSLDANEHDTFRNQKGSHARAIAAIDACLEAGLSLIVSTVVTKQRVHSKELIDYLEFMKAKGIGTFVTYAKPVGAWQGKFDCLVDKDDMKYIDSLRSDYNVFTHLTPSYGMDMGCIAVKRMISITRHGDVMPCPYIHVSLGNVFNEPLKDIVERGMSIKHFGEHVDTCLIAEDRNFIDKYIVGRVYGKPLPVSCYDVFTKEDIRGS